jgi:hypothetical protein
MSASVRSIDDARFVAIGGPELRRGWSRWIDRAAAWDWFTTHTFKEDVSVDQALRLFDRWLARLVEASRQKSRCSPELRCAIAVEWTCRGRVHLHAVISGEGLRALRGSRWRHRWETLGRVCGNGARAPREGSGQRVSREIHWQGRHRRCPRTFRGMAILGPSASSSCELVVSPATGSCRHPTRAASRPKPKKVSTWKRGN